MSADGLKTIREMSGKPRLAPARFVTHEEIPGLVRRAIAEMIMGHTISTEKVYVDQEQTAGRAASAPAVAPKKPNHRKCGICRQEGHRRESCTKNKRK